MIVSVTERARIKSYYIEHWLLHACLFGRVIQTAAMKQIYYRMKCGSKLSVSSSAQETHEEPMSCIGWIAVGYLQRHKSHINFDL